jgi:hypothetical protein
MKRDAVSCKELDEVANCRAGADGPRLEGVDIALYVNILQELLSNNARSGGWQGACAKEKTPVVEGLALTNRIRPESKD